MSDIKETFSSETHQTRCGRPWRWLDVKGQSIVAVVNGDVEDIYLMIELDGKCCANGINLESFDLIPITHKPVGLPTNPREEIRYAAMDKNGQWFGFNRKAEIHKSNVIWFGMGSVWTLSCLDLPKDLAGWENSLHIRTKNGWERVL